MIAYEGAISYSEAIDLPMVEVLRLIRNHNRYCKEVREASTKN